MENFTTLHFKILKKIISAISINIVSFFNSKQVLSQYQQQWSQQLFEGLVDHIQLFVIFLFSFEYSLRIEHEKNCLNFVIKVQQVGTSKTYVCAYARMYVYALVVLNITIIIVYFLYRFVFVS
eukprot:TRINITY_DN12490_c1_g1_i2.p5 TRINITY_DN12490_c1_g1~~TRINITY_DN12490_c1_g1_i2.p5  ORF type:complete len:123 (+),score=1.14 TRINITY_DN12490_c1_g1_i2:482-850(+)